MPGKMKESLDGLGVDTERRRFEHLVMSGDRVCRGATLNKEGDGVADGGWGEKRALFPAPDEGFDQ